MQPAGSSLGHACSAPCAPKSPIPGRSRETSLPCRLLSGEIDVWWRHVTVSRAPPPAAGAILDCCTGTGDLALPPAEIDAKPEAVVRGVVTTACAPAFVIEDAGSAISIASFGDVEADGAAVPIIEPGMILEIEGRVVPGGYVPTLKGRHTRVVGRRPAPAGM
jgi:hypothetical protein